MFLNSRPGRSRSLGVTLAAGGGLALAVAIGPAVAASGTPHTTTFSNNGTFVVPKGVHHITIHSVGAPGGGCAAFGPKDPSAAVGGEGASVTATFNVKPGSHLKVYVGGGGAGCNANLGGTSPGQPGGANGGGSGGASGNTAFAGGGGGGFSGVYESKRSALVVAGGGGGASACAGSGGNAGEPGVSGTDKVDPLGACKNNNNPGGGGQAGTRAKGGAGGAAGATAAAGAAGKQAAGGAGGAANAAQKSACGGGGGGGGYYGGGGGGGGGANSAGGGGGGGSSYVAHGASHVVGPTATASAPVVTITYKSR